MKKNKEEFINKKKQQADETKERLQELEGKIKEKQQKEEELVRLGKIINNTIRTR